MAMTKISSTSVNPPVLHLHWLWLLLGCAGIQALLAVDFIFVPLNFSLPYEDKFYHALAHALPAAWFFMLYRRRFERRALLVAFLLLALFGELLQPLSPYHTFDVWDIFANLAGIGLGWKLAHSRIGTVLERFDHFLASSFKA
jgi:glycopeptide antibiotics resistance protein